jgi:hypothetical protein
MNRLHHGIGLGDDSTRLLQRRACWRCVSAASNTNSSKGGPRMRLQCPLS